MNKAQILHRISRGRADLVFELLHLPDWKQALVGGQIKPLPWFVYYNDVTSLKAILGEKSRRTIISDHGAGWGNGMEWKFLGDYLPEAKSLVPFHSHSQRNGFHHSPNDSQKPSPAIAAMRPMDAPVAMAASQASGALSATLAQKRKPTASPKRPPAPNRTRNRVRSNDLLGEDTRSPTWTRHHDATPF